MSRYGGHGMTFGAGKSSDDFNLNHTNRCINYFVK